MAREAKGFSQAKLAREIASHHSIIGKYERDEVKPTVDVIKKLAAVLGTTISYLMGEADRHDAFKDPVMLRRVADIEDLPERERESLLMNIDNFITASKLKAISR